LSLHQMMMLSRGKRIGFKCFFVCDRMIKPQSMGTAQAICVETPSLSDGSGMSPPVSERQGQTVIRLSGENPNRRPDLMLSLLEKNDIFIPDAEFHRSVGTEEHGVVPG